MPSQHMHLPNRCFLQPENPDFVLGEWLRAQSITLAFVMAYGHYLPKTVREAPKHGMLNFHGSVLPNYRGASPRRQRSLWGILRAVSV